MNTEKILTPKQISDEFGVQAKSIYRLYGKKSKKFTLYVQAWLYRRVVDFLPKGVSPIDVLVVPSLRELADEFDTSDKNMSALRLNKSDMYDIYVDAWNFRHVVLKRIQNT